MTFKNLPLPADRPFKPIIKEGLREFLGVLTSQQRHSKTWIHDRFPSYAFENGFAEDDELWQPSRYEPLPILDARLYELLVDVRANDKNTWLSFTSHGNAIASLARNIGHREWKTGTAGLLPVLIKATLIS